MDKWKATIEVYIYIYIDYIECLNIKSLDWRDKRINKYTFLTAAMSEHTNWATKTNLVIQEINKNIQYIF